MKLTKAKRDKMPKKDFALPGERFPLNNETHDRLAIGGATRAYKAGHISKSQESHIKAEARAKLGNRGGSRTDGHANVKNPERHHAKMQHD